MSIEIKAWIKDIAIAIIAALIISQFITPTIVKEHSMLNTLNENDYIILWKQAYFMKEPEYSDIVVFKSDMVTGSGKKKLLIKRVVGLPGDEITIVDGVVYRNDKALDEPYTKDGYTPGDVNKLIIPENEIFVMGDNRVNSIDSRSSEIGTISEDLIVGKAAYRLYPFNQIGSVYKNLKG